MRLPLLLAIILLISGLPVGAQQPEDLADDASGDVRSASGIPTPTSMAEVDLRRLAIVETPMEILLVVGTSAMSDESEPEMLATAFEVSFQHNGMGFLAYATRNNAFGGGSYFAFLSQVDAGTGRTNLLDQIDVEIDAADDTLTLTLPRALLRDGSGAPPFPGRSLDHFVVTSFANRVMRDEFGFAGASVPDGRYEDRMPNDGSAGPYAIHLGVQQSGNARLTSEEPFRASNGEATTYVFKVKASNLGSDPAFFRFNATSVPTSWDLTLPEGRIEIAGGALISVPIIVSTAFAHSHGSTESFILEMTSEADRSHIGRVEIGVHYPLIPQPAGHHDTMWIHSGSFEADALTTALGTAFGFTPGANAGYVNAIEDDERASEQPIPGSPCSFGLAPGSLEPLQTYCWNLPLDPGLQLGLDFDLARTGRMDLTFGSELPALGAHVSATVLYRPPSPDNAGPGQGPQAQNIVLAVANATAPKDLGASTNFELVLVPTEDADFINYVADASLTVQVRLAATHINNPLLGPRTPSPTLAAGGLIQLPLNEYADPVEGIIQLAATGLEVTLDGEQERFVNPGRTVIYKASVLNQGNATDIRIDLKGANRAWATLAGAPEVRIAREGSTDFAVVVRAPEEALDGELADLVLEISNLEDVSDRTLLRLVVTVDTDEDHPDEEDVAGRLLSTGEKKSPGPALVLPLLGAVLLARRRSG